ncbi:hypothetical protein HDU67_004290, partial [Dinochytrium kinnereticum]
GGDIVMLFMLLNIAPLGYFTEMTTVSSIHELYITSEQVKKENYSDKFFFKDRVAWKDISLSDPFARRLDCGGRKTLRVNAKQMIEFLKSVDRNIIPDDTIFDSLSNSESWAPPKYSRKSLAHLLLLVKKHFSDDWDEIINGLVRSLPNGYSRQSLFNIRKETILHLHVYGLLPLPNREVSKGGFPDPLSLWKIVPEIICLTFVVSREQVQRMWILHEKEIFGKRGLALEMIISYSNAHYRFSDLQFGFGTANLIGEKEFAIVKVDETIQNQTDHAMIISVLVPSSMLESTSPVFKIRINRTPNIVVAPSSEVVLLRTDLTDTKSLFVTSERPHLAGELKKLKTLTTLRPSGPSLPATISNFSLQYIAVGLEEAEKPPYFTAFVDTIDPLYSREFLNDVAWD